MRTVRIVWSAVLLLVTGAYGAQWERTVLSGKGESADIPSPHPLRYFTVGHLQRQVVRAGTLAGFAISTVLFRVLEKGEPATFNGEPQGRIAGKSIVVQTGTDRYIEIYHLQASGPAPDLTPARIVRTGDESILATEDSDGGNGGGCWEGYWWFDRAGPHRIDFSALRPAIAARLPAGARFSTACASLHLENGEIRSAVQEAGAECHSCGYIGEVTAHFHLHGAQVEAGQIDFLRQPDAPRE